MLLRAPIRDTFKWLTSALQLSSDPTTMASTAQIGVSYTGHSQILPPAPPPALNEKDFPQVRFWTQDKFKNWEKLEGAKRQGAPRRRDDSSTSLPWLEDQHGNTLSKESATAILKKMRGIWHGFKQRGIAPSTWGAATDEVKTAFYVEVTLAFPQLRLCSNNWKAEAVATARYSSWAQTYLKDSKESGKRQVKSEGESVEPDCKRLKTESSSGEDIEDPMDTSFAIQDISTSSSASPIESVMPVESVDSESATSNLSTSEEIPIVKNPL